MTREGMPSSPTVMNSPTFPNEVIQMVIEVSSFVDLPNILKSSKTIEARLPPFPLPPELFMIANVVRQSSNPHRFMTLIHSWVKNERVHFIP
jgi:hypothetical protein